jgi:hypothetical protein
MQRWKFLAERKVCSAQPLFCSCAAHGSYGPPLEDSGQLRMIHLLGQTEGQILFAITSMKWQLCR